jgi:hypothetical protein
MPGLSLSAPLTFLDFELDADSQDRPAIHQGSALVIPAIEVLGFVDDKTVPE